MRATLPLLALLAACNGDPKEKQEESCSDDAGTICAWAGTGDAAYDGGGNDRLDSMFYYPQDVEFSPFGRPIISDWNNHKLRMVEDDGTLTTVMGSDFVGDGPPDKSDLTAPGAPGTTVNLNHPTQQAYYPDGILLSASWHTHKMRNWDPATGLVMVVMGSSPGFGGEDGTEATAALLNQPRGVVIDSNFDAYIVDMRNERVRMLSSDGLVYNIAGSGVQDYCGDGGPAIDACFRFPLSSNPEPGGALALSADEKLLYVADTENHRIRVIDLETGIINSFAGTGTAGFSGDGGAAADAQLNYPRDIVVTDDGRLLIADTENHRIRSIDLATGTITTIAGAGDSGDSGDGGDALSATFNRPFGVEFDEADGSIYVSDTFNHRIRVIKP